MALITPNLVVRTVCAEQAVNFLDNLPEHVRGVTYDLDSTIIEHHGESIAEEQLGFLRQVADRSIQQCIVSNARSEPRTARALALAEQVESAIGAPFLCVTSRMVTPAKGKPRPFVFDRAAELMGLSRTQVCHVGDQLLKDVLGANLAEYGLSVLVAPLGKQADWRVRLFQRPPEAVLRRIRGMPLFTDNFPTQCRMPRTMTHRLISRLV
jgi:predicted HAD superfamily phosphohydrolase YqeG